MPPETRCYTIHEYLALEEAADVKHEFDNGAVIAMSSGTFQHSQITVNLTSELRTRLKGSPCQTLESNMRLRVKNAGKYVYPDITVICNKPVFDSDDLKQTTITNPTVIIEVLSQSTERYDRGKKFDAYRELPTLREYVLISQDEPRVDIYQRRDDGQWVFKWFQGMEQSAEFESLGISIPMHEIYLNVEFQPMSRNPSSEE